MAAHLHLLHSGYHWSSYSWVGFVFASPNTQSGQRPYSHSWQWNTTASLCCGPGPCWSVSHTAVMSHSSSLCWMTPIDCISRKELLTYSKRQKRNAGSGYQVLKVLIPGLIYIVPLYIVPPFKFALEKSDLGALFSCA